MEKIAYDGKYFLGAIKFFDNNKDFGFIASNHCGMPLHSAYRQDFYVNSESFAEEEAKVEGRVVVFQILEQRKGREKAINVRRYTRTKDDDVQLALSYYGEYEKIEIKDGRTVNLYCSCSKPRKLVAEKVAGIIQKDKERSPETTFKHFDFFIKHYKTGFSLKDKYIFDKDFDTDEKQIWVDFFSILTAEEWPEILKAYPSACRYVTDPTILDSWVDSQELGDPQEYLSQLNRRSRSLYFHDFERFTELNEFEEIANLLPDGPKEKYLAKIQLLADEIASGIIKLLVEGCYDEAELYESLKWVLHHTPNKHEKELKEAEELLAFESFQSSVQGYLRNPQNYLKEHSISPNRYSTAPAYFNAYETERHKSNELAGHISRYFEGLDDAKRSEVIEKVLPDITTSLEKYFDEGNLEAIVGTFVFFNFLDENYKRPYLERLYPLVKEYLCGVVQNAINEGTGLPDLFTQSYQFLTSQFDDRAKQMLHDEVLAVMRTANNIELISNCSEGRDKEWLSTEEAHIMADAIVKEWNFENFLNFFKRNYEHRYSTTKTFSRTNDLRLLIAGYAFNLIKPFNLSGNFDVSPMDAVFLKGKFAQPENIRFLEYLIELLPDGKNNTLWSTYISERSKTDLLALYDKGIISSLPLTIIEDIVNEITLDNVLADKERWYRKPILPEGPVKNILVNASDDLFSAIAKRLAAMPLTDENIPLAVFLAELMKINKPSDLDGWNERNWESNFLQKLKEFRATLPNDSKLAVLLWAVHFNSSGSMSLLPDIFHLLPPYVQIRVVKRLFSAIATGKFYRTAASLYETIGGDKHRICLPLEIVFEYLKLREIDPSAELNNNVMLRLLDGREDHGEWIGIRQFVTECRGRVYTQDIFNDHSSWKRDFYNGAIGTNKEGDIIVFVPEKMIDDSNELQQYNNKYKAAIKELISITFSESEYAKKETSDGVYYVFDDSKEKELYTLARYYNLRYKGVNRNIEFKTNDIEDVFCECRMSDKLDNYHSLPFYWCGNKPCFRVPIRFHIPSEWEAYTLLDFMRILGIPTDYTDRYGKSIRFGYYIFVSGYLKSFAKFYEHLKCRSCGQLMRPKNISNFAGRAVNEFACTTPDCQEQGNIVYLNHCFNKPKCNATIDSRDSKTCPNGQYICPECGGCCSTQNFRNRLSYLDMTGGVKSSWLINFVRQDLGHWEKGERFCYKCGRPMKQHGVGFTCENCKTEYK